MEYCEGLQWMNPKGAGGKPLDSGGATADGEPFDSHLASDSDVSEETLHLSASTGGPSLTVKKKVKTKNANDNKTKKKTKKIMHI